MTVDVPSTWRRAIGQIRRVPALASAFGGPVPAGSTLSLTSPSGEAVAQALRTGSGVAAGAGWVWPYWLERQLDPSSPAFVPAGDLPLVQNLVARNWTTVGNVGSPAEALVDPRGLVTPTPGGWSLDWWIGADDRWHVPSREVAVRQRLVEDAPVVETVMRVPGGDAVHRAYAVRAAPADGGHELMVVEIENASPVPFAVALAVRPYHPAGLARVGEVAVTGGTTVTVEGRIAVLLPRVPNRSAAATGADGDVAGVVLAGDAGSALPEPAHCPDGMATAAFVYPLAHTATLRVVLPLAAAEPAGAPAGTDGAAPPAVPARLPTAVQVAAGWRAHAGAGSRVELPDDRLASCVEANRRTLLLRHDRLVGAGGEDVPVVEVAALVRALDGWGHADEAAEGLRDLAGRQRADGGFAGHGEALDANGAVLHALRSHLRLHGDDGLAAELAESVADAATWIERTRRSGRRRPGVARGLLPSACYADDLWSLRGLLDAADLLTAAGEAAGAAAAAEAAVAYRGDLDASLAAVAARLGTVAVPAGWRHRIDDRAVGALAACSPLGLLDAADPRIVATVEAVREHALLGAAVHEATGSGGLGTEATVQLALAELAAGDPRSLDRLAWLLDAATPTWTWPDAVHPRLAGGCAGDGHSSRVLAGILSVVRELLVRETADGLDLCSLLPPSWWGGGIEAHGVPTAAGTLSFAVRWHGERPALLWELEPADGGAVRLRAPGLDPAWSSAERSGEALLAPVPLPVPVPEEAEEPEEPSGSAAPPGPGSATPVGMPQVRRREPPAR